MTRSFLLALLALVGCQTSGSSTSSDTAVDASNSNDAEAMRAEPEDRRNEPATIESQIPFGDPVLTERMAALIQPRETPVVESPETTPADVGDITIDPGHAPAYQGHGIAVFIDGTRTTPGRMGKYGQLWNAGEIAPTPRIRVEVIDPALGEMKSVEIVIHRVVAGIVSKPDFYLDERVTRQMEPGKDFTLGEFSHFMPPRGSFERVQSLPPGAYRFVLLVLTRLEDGTSAWDRQLIDAVVPDASRAQ